jgi:hypothetical protein
VSDIKFDPSVPDTLKMTQQWFGTVIARPIDENSRINPVSPSGQPMDEEAKQFISPSPTLQPHKRIEIYNQQYWWRLLSILHDIFPLTNRLFGYFDFNQSIGIPYLLANPPHTWSLNPLGHKLPAWIQEEYRSSDKSFVFDAAAIDLAYNDGFLTEQQQPLSLSDLPDPNDISYLLDKKLTLQPHIYLFSLDYDLFKFRDEMLGEEPEHWEDHDFPELQKDKQYSFCLFRNHFNNMCWEEIEEPELFLLNLFKHGTTIEKALQALEDEHEQWIDESAGKLSDWFQKWIARKWLFKQ